MNGSSSLRFSLVSLRLVARTVFVLSTLLTIRRRYKLRKEGCPRAHRVVTSCNEHSHTSSALSGGAPSHSLSGRRFAARELEVKLCTEYITIRRGHRVHLNSFPFHVRATSFAPYLRFAISIAERARVERASLLSNYIFMTIF